MKKNGLADLAQLASLGGLVTTPAAERNCPGCGQPRTYAHDADSEKHWHAPDATRCHACTAIAAKRRKYEATEILGAARE